MTKKMPKEIWLQAPIDTPEKGWKDGEVTWCWHPINENEDNDPDTKYLRADTCTPNEECVSKAEIEDLIRHWESVRSNYGEEEKEHEIYSLVLVRLREVMDK